MTREEKKARPESPPGEKNSPAGVSGALEDEMNKLTPGHRLLFSLFKLFQMVKIHQANNKLVIETIIDFTNALHTICKQFDGVYIRVYRERIYLNHERLIFAPNMMITVNKLLEFLQKRDIRGFRLYEKENLTNEEIVQVIKLLNQADREKAPIAWLQVQLDVINHTWIELLVDQDKKTDQRGIGTELNGQETSTNDPEADNKKTNDEEGAAANENMTESGKLTPSKNNAPVTNDDLAQVTYSYVMASMARKAYSHALTSVLDMTGKYTLKKEVGIQKSKRVVQGMIDILTKDDSILLGLSTIRNYDDYTYSHSVNVAILSMCLGRRLGLTRRLMEQLGLCGLFHDLGKINAPINLITKGDPLTNDEYEEIKKHSINSVRQIIRLNADHSLKSKLLLPPFEHHLGIDLSGYPQTSRRAPISLLGRILAVADNYDAMTSNRSYRATPINPDIALKIMIDEAGHKLDPLILKIFIKMIGIYPVGSLLVLDTREIGLATSTPVDADSGRPIVCLLNWSKNGGIKKGNLVDLAQRDEKTGKFLRNIIQCLHPNKFGIQPADYLV